MRKAQKGTLIVLEGTDGSGKHTQTKMLCDALHALGYAPRQLSFPCYGTPACAPVEMYLRGDFGNHPDDVSPYAASIFYATDRFASFKTDWGEIYNSGGLVITDRYTTSNAVHQAAKLTGEAREEYLDWLFRLEYDKMGLPSPDMVFFLDVPTDITQAMMRERESNSSTSPDIHEQDTAYLARCRASALEIAHQLGWTIVNCSDDGKMRPAEEIHRTLLAIVRARYLDNNTTQRLSWGTGYLGNIGRE